MAASDASTSRIGGLAKRRTPGLPVKAPAINAVRSVATTSDRPDQANHRPQTDTNQAGHDPRCCNRSTGRPRVLDGDGPVPLAGHVADCRAAPGPKALTTVTCVTPAADRLGRRCRRRDRFRHAVGAWLRAKNGDCTPWLRLVLDRMPVRLSGPKSWRSRLRTVIDIKLPTAPSRSPFCLRLPGSAWGVKSLTCTNLGSVA